MEYFLEIAQIVVRARGAHGTPTHDVAFARVERAARVACEAQGRAAGGHARCQTRGVNECRHELRLIYGLRASSSIMQRRWTWPWRSAPMSFLVNEVSVLRYSSLVCVDYGV